MTSQVVERQQITPPRLFGVFPLTAGRKTSYFNGSFEMIF